MGQKPGFTGGQKMAPPPDLKSGIVLKEVFTYIFTKAGKYEVEAFIDPYNKEKELRGLMIGSNLILRSGFLTPFITEVNFGFFNGELSTRTFNIRLPPFGNNFNLNIVSFEDTPHIMPNLPGE